MVQPDYAYYALNYNGGLSEEEFARILPRATAVVNSLIFGRKVPDAVADNVRSAICAVVDEIDATSSGVVASATNDGYSETYAVTRTSEQRVKDAAALYLSTTGLLFCGGLPRC